MGLFDGIKNIVKNNVNDSISQAIDEKKSDIGEKMKDGVKDYFENVKNLDTTTDDGKKAIDSLINLVDDSYNVMNESVSVNGNSSLYEDKVKDDFEKLGDATNVNIKFNNDK